MLVRDDVVDDESSVFSCSHTNMHAHTLCLFLALFFSFALSLSHTHRQNTPIFTHTHTRTHMTARPTICISLQKDWSEGSVAEFRKS